MTACLFLCLLFSEFSLTPFKEVEGEADLNPRGASLVKSEVFGAFTKWIEVYLGESLAGMANFGGQGT